MKRIMNIGRLKMTSVISKVALAALLVVAMMGSMEVQAQTYYVFYNSTNGYIYNIDDENVGVKTDFDASCVWYTENSALSTNTSYTLRSYVIYQGTANWYLYATAGQGVTGALSVSSSSFSNWRIDSNSYLIRRGTRSSYYVNYSNSAWTSNTTEVSSNSFIAYQVTKNDVAASLTTPTISPTFKELDYNEAAIFTASATTTPAYTTFTFNGNTYYYYNNTVSSSAPTATSTGVTYSWTLTGAANSYLSPTSGTGTTITVTHSTQAPDDATSTLSVTATANGLSATSTSNATITAAAPKVDPTGISITSADPMTVYVGQTGAITYSLTPNPCYNNVVFTSTNTGIATVAADGVVTGVAVGSTTITASAKNIDGTVAASATVTVNVRNKVATPVISFTPDALDNTKATATVTCATSGVTIYYTTDGSDPTSSSTEYTEPFHVNDGDEVRAIAIKTTDGTNWDNSDIASATYVSCTTDDPVITYTASGSTATVTITGEAGATIYYTTDGSTPTSSSISGTSPVTVSGVANFATVKAYAKSSTCQASGVVSKDIVFSGTSGSMVILNDLEDHSWSYYSDPDCPIRSLNPADVKITYYGNGTGNMTSSSEDGNTPNSFSENATGVKVGIASGEDQNTFVYYKTLERTDGSTATTVAGATGRCAYTTIPNPFQVRPVSGTSSTKYRGFYKWRVKSVTGGTIYTTSTGNTTIAAGGTIDADTEIYFAPTSEYGMEVELEALWAQAYVSTSSAGSYSVGVERNFYVITSSANSNITAGSYPCTYTSIYPNGTTDGTAAAESVSVYKYGGFTASADSKIENIILQNNNSTINAAGKNFTIGRGVSGYSSGYCTASIYGCNSNSNINQVFRIESGTWDNMYAIGSSGPTNNMTKQHIFLGSDYDRAKTDNSKLNLKNQFKLLDGKCSTGTDKLIITAKSGQFTSELDHSTAQASGNCFYLWYSTANTDSPTGTRTLRIEGGEFWHIAGGLDEDNTETDISLKVRVKGGTIHGSIFGGGARYDVQGGRQMIFTGGTIEGWIAGGSNGYLAEASRTYDNGTVKGNTYVYVGGTTQVNSNGSTTAINVSLGGNVYGAGCGNTTNDDSGRVTLGTNVVVADNAYIERGVYGGGAYGSSPATANVYILGGEVGGVGDATFNAQGGVYGGARAKGGCNANIYMTGGLVKTGLYGGSNTSGTLTGNVIMNINGGQVGTSSQTANIHGGGYGSATIVSGDVDITLGSSGQTEEGVTVYGDVYGGSALGSVNGTSATTTYHTNVTLNKGTINGSLYGGGLGNASTAANVYGPVEVKVTGGKVTGAVFGCNNVMGSPKSSVEVVIAGTDATTLDGSNNKVYALNGVYGGGNLAHYDPTTPTANYPSVTVSGCSASIKDVYGGGNAAAVPNTKVVIKGGDIDRAFAGGNGESGTPAHVGYKNTDAAPVTGTYGTGTANITINGGTINKVFGGSNKTGVIRGAINVTAEKTDDCDADMLIDELYGGGNEAASNAGNITVGCLGSGGRISSVYGGANAADISGNISLTVNAGNIGNVFGGNNASGTISGTISVEVNKTGSCDVNIDNVYGGGNLAAYSAPAASSNYPYVNIVSGTVTGGVYGGGLGASAVVTGNPRVTVGGGTLNNIFGGGDAAHVDGNTSVTVSGGTISGAVFGGGNDIADVGGVKKGVSGNATVSISGASVGTGVYGGCNVQGTVGGNTTLTLTGGTVGTSAARANVHGGGYGKDTGVDGNVEVNIGSEGLSTAGVTIYGDVYGGSALGNVNGTSYSSSSTKTTEVNLWKGTIYGDAYGGGLGQKAVEGVQDAISALVNGDVTVSLYDVVFDVDYTEVTSAKGTVFNTPTTGRIFGCNNLNGTPKGDVTVDIHRTHHISHQDTRAVGDYELGAVYGGGNEAEYLPESGKKTTVNIRDCASSIYYVYGGGNAASVPDCAVNVEGAFEINYLFGGGNGADPSKPGANVGYRNDGTTAYGGGTAETTVLGGTVHYIFGGSNSNGNIRTSAEVTLEESDDECPLNVIEVFGAGNEAFMDGSTAVNIGCLDSEFEYIYGGAKHADINNNVELNITSGSFSRVFGGNRDGGKIYGTITVTVQETGCKAIHIGELYGGGDEAPYDVAWIPESVRETLADETAYRNYPQVNIISATEIGTVYGGGKGSGATVTGNPHVNINMEPGILNNDTPDDDTDDIPQPLGTIGTVYGGGNAAKVFGDTYVHIGTGKNEAGEDLTRQDAQITGNVYGGGNEADVTGETHVVIGK